MNPIEKAKELYDKFEDVMIDADAYFVESGGYRAAIKAVDEILKMAGNLNFDFAWNEHTITDINNWLDNESIKPVRMNALQYWTEVKNELEYMRTKHLPK